MFTGIVQATGFVRSIQRGSNGVRLVLDAPELTRPIPDGASVCVSGVCLTVTGSDAISLRFDIVPETLARSTLGSLSPGSRVNLERSLQVGGGLDGHIVQGHIDGTGRVNHIQKSSNGRVVTIAIDESLRPFIIPKGSIALDGISLTIASVEEDLFSVALIPTTLAATTLDALRVGDQVNLETDILARTIVTTLQRWHKADPQSAFSVDDLRAHGW